jgi:hypothetical protein
MGESSFCGTQGASLLASMVRFPEVYESLNDMTARYLGEKRRKE